MVLLSFIPDNNAIPPPALGSVNSWVLLLSISSASSCPGGGSIGASSYGSILIPSILTAIFPITIGIYQEVESLRRRKDQEKTAKSRNNQIPKAQDPKT